MANKSVIIVLIVLVSFVAGVFVTGLYFGSKIKQLNSRCSSGGSAVANNAPNAQQIPADIAAKISSISGNVEKIEGDTLTVKTFFLGEQKSFSVKVSPSTSIKKKEMRLETSKSEEGKTSVAPLIKETDAQFGDIRQNDNIFVETGESIKNKTDLDAKELMIIIEPSP